ncbi:MAG: hypothetical protein RR585_15750 [Coprobacillus sp.]
MKYHCYNCKSKIEESVRFIEESGKVLCEVCSIGTTPCTDRDRFIIDLIGEDLRDIYYYFYRDELFIKSPILAVDHRNLEVIFQNGSINITKDIEIIKIKRPSNIIKTFKWCYKLSNKDNELLGYIGK